MLGVEAGRAVLTVRDNGTGIAADMLPRVFDMFAQVEQARPQSRGGLGLGLTISRTLVELHGGTIEVHSDGPGRGSQFIVRLPIVAVNHEVGPAKSPTLDRPTLRQRRILVVDDTRVAVYTLGKLLEALGQQVSVAYDAAAALQTARAERPELVISDIGMPGMDGYELARQIRQAPELSAIVLVALTGYGQDSDRRRALASGFDAHLIKPVSVQALQELLESLPEPLDQASPAPLASRQPV
jgi:two-component system CheB/CheR fusion protein